MPHAFRFFPNLRLGGTVGAVMGADGRLQNSFDVEIQAGGATQGAPVSMTARFRGPGDVTGINPAEIARFEPLAGALDFEPDYFPFVEFRSPDLPWRFGLGDGHNGEPAPWLVLIALRGDEYTTLPRGSAPNGRILVHDAQASLPPLGQRWAFAHVQLNTGSAEGPALAELEANPDQAFARLICPRKLEPRMRYHLFVVPAYEVGRLAGLGLDPAETPESASPTLAWDNARPEAVELPHYASSSFRTDEGLNLEAALRRLRSLDDKEADALAGADSFRADQPGYFLRRLTDRLKPEGKGEVQTALMPTGKPRSPNPFPRQMKLALSHVLNEVVEGELFAPDEALPEAERPPEEDPLVAFPPYGFRYMKEPTYSANSKAWPEEINLDPQFRLAARLGADCVADNQEQLMHMAWRQYPQIVENNRQLARLKAATALANRLSVTRFEKLPSDVALAISEPFVPYATHRDSPLGDSKARMTIGNFLGTRGTPAAYPTRDMRRIAARFALRQTDTKVSGVPSPGIPGDETPSAISRPRDRSALRDIEQRLKKRKGGATVAALRASGLLRQELPDSSFRPRTVTIAVKPFSSARLHRDLAARLKALPALKAAFRIKGRTEAEAKRGGGVIRAPRLAVPLVNYMIRRDPAALMAGVDDLPEDTISFYQENRAFVEALMAGANHAMNDELRWRGFPTDMNSTVMHRFWDRGFVPEDTSKDDIGAIRGWRGPLGHQPSPIDRDGKPNVVVLIKGAVVRKLDEPILRIDLHEKREWTPQVIRSLTPSFSGKMRDDVAYYGFDISLEAIMDPGHPPFASFVILEPPGRLRFGLDVASLANRHGRDGAAAGALETWDDLAWPHLGRTASGYVRANQRLEKPRAGGPDLWGDARNAATIARSFWQKPIAAVVPFLGVFDGK